MNDQLIAGAIAFVTSGALLGLYNAFFKNRRSDVLIMIDGYRGQLTDAERHIAQLEARFDALEKELNAEKGRRFLAEESHSAAQQTIALLEGHMRTIEEQLVETADKNKHLETQLTAALRNGGRLRKTTPKP